MTKSKKRTVVFRDPGGSITIGAQRFHQGNITPEVYDELVKIDASHQDKFEVIEADADRSATLEELEKEAAKEAKSGKPKPADPT